MAILFDPRINDLVETENPALIFADAIIRLGGIAPDKKFWKKITLLAEYCDSGNGMGKVVNAEYMKQSKVKSKIGRPKGSKNKKEYDIRPEI